MSEGWTPGPWSVTTCNEGESCWCRIISCPASEGSDGNDWVIGSGAVQKRDAHLIASSLELYAALEALLFRCELYLGKSTAGYTDDAIMIAARAALAKARGEQVLGAGVKIGATPDAPNTGGAA